MVESECLLQNRPFKQINLNEVRQMKAEFSYYDNQQSDLDHTSVLTKELTMRCDTNDDYSVPGSVTPGKISENRSLSSFAQGHLRAKGNLEEEKYSNRQLLIEVLNRSTSPQASSRGADPRTLSIA